LDWFQEVRVYLDVVLVLVSVAVLVGEDGLADGAGQRVLHVRLNVQLQAVVRVRL
jgi:hypothetical protein